MRKIIVSAWVTIDGVFDAETMEQWWEPYHSDERAKYIQETILNSGALLMGRTTYEMLAPYWSAVKNNEMGIADKISSVRKYVVSSTLEKAEWNNSTIIKESVVSEIDKLKREPGHDIIVTGGPLLLNRSCTPTLSMNIDS